MPDLAASVPVLVANCWCKSDGKSCPKATLESRQDSRFQTRIVAEQSFGFILAKMKRGAAEAVVGAVVRAVFGAAVRAVINGRRNVRLF